MKFTDSGLECMTPDCGNILRGVKNYDARDYCEDCKGEAKKPKLKAAGLDLKDKAPPPYVAKKFDKLHLTPPDDKEPA